MLRVACCRVLARIATGLRGVEQPLLHRQGVPVHDLPASRRRLRGGFQHRHIAQRECRVTCVFMHAAWFTCCRAVGCGLEGRPHRSSPLGLATRWCPCLRCCHCRLCHCHYVVMWCVQTSRSLQQNYSYQVKSSNTRRRLSMTRPVVVFACTSSPFSVATRLLAYAYCACAFALLPPPDARPLLVYRIESRLSPRPR